MFTQFILCCINIHVIQFHPFLLLFFCYAFITFVCHRTNKAIKKQLVVGGFLIKIRATIYRKFIMYQALCEMFWIHDYLKSSQLFDLLSHICYQWGNWSTKKSNNSVPKVLQWGIPQSIKLMLFLLEFIQVTVAEWDWENRFKREAGQIY